MDENKRVLGSNLDQVDAHVVGPDDYDDAPELTDEWFEKADLYDNMKLVRRGKRPETELRPVELSLSADVLAYFQSQGEDWQRKLDYALVEWIAAQPAREAMKAGSLGSR